METWTCGVCGAVTSLSERICSACRAARPAGMTRVYNVPKPPTEGGAVPAAPREIRLPLYVPDVRFTTGSNWTHGAMHLRTEGLFLLSDQDGLASPEKAGTRKVPPGDDPVAVSLSQWFPAKSIAKVLHSPLAGFAIVARGKKTAIRMSGDAWAQLGGWCRLQGIEF